MMWDDGLIITKEHLPIVVTRFLCAMLLHFQMDSELQQAFRMLKYFLNHCDNSFNEIMKVKVVKEVQDETYSSGKIILKFIANSLEKVKIPEHKKSIAKEEAFTDRSNPK